MRECGQGRGISPDDVPKLGEGIRAKADIVEKPKPKPSY